MQTAPARSQPISRGPICDGGAATATGRTKTSSAAVAPVAACGVTMPAKSTRKPTTAMAATASTLWVETRVPNAMNPQPTARRTR